MSTLFNSPVGNITARPPELGEEVFLHPVVALMIADHHTTATTVTHHTHKNKRGDAMPSGSGSDVHAIGILMGHRRRKSLEISSAFELVFSFENGNNNNNNSTDHSSSLFNEEIAIQRRDLAKGLYNTLEVVGWYVIVDKNNNKKGEGGGPAMSESFFESVNESVKALFEMDAPIVAVADFSKTTKSNANTNNNSNSDNVKFPLSLFETPSEEFVHKYLTSLPCAGGSGGGNICASGSTKSAGIPPEMKARKITFSFTASESERIATDLLLRLEGGGGGAASSSSADSTSRNNNKAATSSSSVEQHAHRLQTSSVLLGKAIDTIIAYLEGVLAYHSPTTTTTTGDRGKNSVVAVANKKGVVPISDPDPELLRLIMGIVQALPCGTAYTNGSSASSSSFVANEGGGCVKDGPSTMSSLNKIDAGRHGPSDRDFIENLLVAYVSVVQKSAAKIEPLLKSTNGVVRQQRREEEEKARKTSSGRNNGPDSLI